MWYVMQVYSGQEEYVKELIEKHGCQENIEDCKIPLYERMRKRDGIWYPETKVLFSGYLFVKTSNVLKLYEQLRAIPKMTRLLGTEKEIVPITREEEQFLTRIGGNDLIVKISKGIINQGELTVTSGPLQNMESCIKKIDRHKRLAWAEIRMFGKNKEIPLGLDVWLVL